MGQLPTPEECNGKTIGKWTEHLGIDMISPMEMIGILSDGTGEATAIIRKNLRLTGRPEKSCDRICCSYQKKGGQPQNEDTH